MGLGNRNATGKGLSTNRKSELRVSTPHLSFSWHFLISSFTSLSFPSAPDQWFLCHLLPRTPGMNSPVYLWTAGSRMADSWDAPNRPLHLTAGMQLLSPKMSQRLPTWSISQRKQVTKQVGKWSYILESENYRGFRILGGKKNLRITKVAIYEAIHCTENFACIILFDLHNPLSIDISISQTSKSGLES